MSLYGIVVQTKSRDLTLCEGYECTQSLALCWPTTT